VSVSSILFDPLLPWPAIWAAAAAMALLVGFALWRRLSGWAWRALAAAAILAAIANPSIPFRVGSFEAIPAGESAFDAVVAQIADRPQ